MLRAFAAAAILTLSAAAAQAGDATVRIDDINPSTGAQVLAARVNDAAQLVCASPTSHADNTLADRQQFESCVRRANRVIAAQVDKVRAQDQARLEAGHKVAAN